jgi:hypothetical protein
MEDAPEEPAVAEEPDSPPSKRTFITLQRKVDLCAEAEENVFVSESMSLKAFCRANDIQPSQLRRWKKNLLMMKKTIDSTTKKKTKKVCTVGRPSRLEGIRDRLMPWVNVMMQDGKTVSIRQAAIHAKCWDKSLR